MMSINTVSRTPHPDQSTSPSFSFYGFWSFCPRIALKYFSFVCLINYGFRACRGYHIDFEVVWGDDGSPLHTPTINISSVARDLLYSQLASGAESGHDYAGARYVFGLICPSFSSILNYISMLRFGHFSKQNVLV